MASTSEEGYVNTMRQGKPVQSLQKYSYEPKRVDQKAVPTVLSAIAEAGYMEHTAEQTPAQVHAMKLLLRTRHNNVFQFNEDQSVYMSPPVLRGTPVKRITESSSYWQPDWLSLDKYLDAEASEIKLKEQFGRRVASQGITSKTDPLKREHKLHMDNCSKHIKIREIFGPNSAYHPNQLVAKRHLPATGLCEQEIMYKMACKVSDLQVLHKKGELTMDPFEFYRFQIAKQIEKHIAHPGQSASSFIKTIIRTLGDDDTKGGKFQDPVFRTIVRRAAHFTGRSNSYGSKNTKKSGRIYKNFATPYVRRSLPAAATQYPEREKERRQKKLARRATQPSLYGGINAYRSKAYSLIAEK